ncbi:MAG: DUF5011 domain-containing protein [Cyclobacteriaceae bacterium]
MNKFLKNALLVAMAACTILLVNCTEDEGDDLPAVVAGFTQIINTETGEVTFTNTSENATIYSWDFGDGTTSTLKDPVKSYTENDTYKVVLTASNDDGDSDTAEADVVIDVVVPDTEVPVITLLGDAEMTITVGDTFADPGATANDNVDGDISTSIVVTGTVDVSTIATYTLNYNVSDAAGNAAAEVSRTVIVAEKVRVEDGLLTNGDFEDGAENWFTNYDGGPEVRSEGGNKFFYAEVTAANPEQPFAVNLSQKLELTMGESYILSFQASSDRERTIIAGIGLNQDPWTNVNGSVNLTTSSQEFTLKFTANFGNENSRVLFDLNGENGVVVIDNVKLEVDPDGGGGSGDAPATAAPTPTTDATDVISVFSDAYTNIEGVNTNPDWGQGTVATEEMVDSNNTLKYVSLNYQGTDFSGAPQDVSAKKYIHVDVWTANASTINFSLISTAGPTEKAYGLSITTGEWVSYDIELSNFSGVDLTTIDQIKIDDAAAGDVPTIWVDNMYFHGTSDGNGGGGETGDNLAANGDFEEGNGDGSGWLTFDNGGSVTFDNSTSNGGTYSAKIATNGASNPGLKQEGKGAGTVKAGDVIEIKFDHKGAVGGDGGVFNVLLFGEQAGDGASFTHVFDPRPTLSDSWSTFTATYTIPDGLDVSGGISFLIESVCGAVEGCSVSANVDNVSVSIKQ